MFKLHVQYRMSESCYIVLEIDIRKNNSVKEFEQFYKKFICSTGSYCRIIKSRLRAFFTEEKITKKKAEEARLIFPVSKLICYD